MLSLPSLANEKAAATESLSLLTYEPTLEKPAGSESVLCRLP